MDRVVDEPGSGDLREGARLVVRERRGAELEWFLVNESITLTSSIVAAKPEQPPRLGHVASEQQRGFACGAVDNNSTSFSSAGRAP